MRDAVDSGVHNSQAQRCVSAGQA